MLEVVTQKNYPMKGNLDLVEQLRNFSGLDFLTVEVMQSVCFKNSKGVHWLDMSEEEKTQFIEDAYDRASKVYGLVSFLKNRGL